MKGRMFRGNIEGGKRKASIFTVESHQKGIRNEFAITSKMQIPIGYMYTV